MARSRFSTNCVLRSSARLSGLRFASKCLNDRAWDFGSAPNIKQEQINGWRKRAGDGTKKGIDTTHFSCLVLAATNTAIFLNNEEVVDDDGDPVVLSSETILNMTGAARVADTIRDIFVVDPHIDMTALKILEYAGTEMMLTRRKAHGGLVQQLAQDSRIKTAARVGELFGIDPVAVLVRIWMSGSSVLPL